ncbi:phosphate ABC transporter ATP-binding protein PstB [Helicobacter cappadocius]|uniref:Phosphate ABC transporter ATP-binding protein PstB n=1 Tax=Helicobacter cappadocius TaxID=3063998 RepID=A0AA90PJQ9_9HELI|nr:MULTISPECIES: phosphate ABC transporter ATP-binding protein PstB [unclassified Helicobacter]MDO7253609.1 phosphate ABC transporter ATP-binding protein PstB [Helicobacter sp. faydin-H75]MDP2539537.1 phosphate ABC transporter ATP-binding protein PstB [Helicobacter sp. faydin-H76]
MNKIAIEAKNLSFYYPNSDKPSISNIDLKIPQNKVLALIGPSGCGKSTLLRCFNRMHCLYDGSTYKGEIIFEDKNILKKKTDLIALRTQIGMIFQKPTPFPMSIFENVAYGLRLKGIKNKMELFPKVEKALKNASLWNEVKDRLDGSADSLSGGQQQRLCIARAIAIEPEILLFDEPTSALDPISTEAIEDLLKDLKKKMSIIIVTHNMQQAQRVSDYTAFMYLGKLIEIDKTQHIFENPKEKLTREYIKGKFG